MRHWVHWISSDDRRVLQCFHLGGRKQAEWDDHKESYPITLDGPHIYGTFKVPSGKYIMSFYFFNKDGHGGANRLRDYILSVKTMKMPNDIFEKLNKEKNNEEKLFMQKPTISKTRIYNFLGGVYKRFYVEVPPDEVVTFRLDSNYSFNTIVCGVFFDSAGEMESVNPENPLPQTRQPANLALKLNEPLEPWWRRINLMEQLLCLRDRNSRFFYSRTRPILLTNIRATVNLKNNIPTTPDRINATDKKMIRSDVATLIRYTQLFQITDRVDFTNTKYELHSWQERTKLGRNKCDNYEWDWKIFNKFTEQEQNKESW
ncbi:MAG: hypothetical protein LBC74_09530 [Planctomycetaceae bacterium]|nr:hypothetical protein [Planctomycetaceae bacterium]